MNHKQLTIAQRPELLAPAGSILAFEAAVKAGADAVYFGLGAFNARGEAANLNLSDLPTLLAEAALADVKTYLTLNTLLKNSEIQAALDLAAVAYREGVDAVILQDKGLVLALKRYLPELSLHGSTQMTLTHTEALYEAKELGLSRVILPRELSFSELQQMQDTAQQLGLETEIFVHGALCVCVSGQCALSYFNGGRSANRGACAQACRLNYSLELDDKIVKEGALLSPKDQALIMDIAAISSLGIHSIKIEGRRRSATYVATATAAYRQAIDNPEMPNADKKKDLLLAFNRGAAFTRNWFADERKADFLSGDWPGSYGVKIGTVVEAQDKSGILMLRPDDYELLKDDLVPASVIALRDEHHQIEIASAPIGKIRYEAGLLQIKAFHPKVLRTVTRGLSAYLMQSQALVNKAKHGKTKRKRFINFNLEKQDSTIILHAASSEHKLSYRLEQDPAYPPLTPDRIQQALGKLGSSAFQLATCTIDGPVHLPLAALNQARRSLCEKLELAIIEANRRESLTINYSLADFSYLKPAINKNLIQRQTQLESAQNWDNRTLYFQNYKGRLQDITAYEKNYSTIVIPLPYLAENPELYRYVMEDKEGRYALAMPIVFSHTLKEKWLNILAELSEKAPRLVYCPSAGGKRLTEKIKQVYWTMESGSHLMNSLTALWSLAQGTVKLAPADELSAEETALLLENLTSVLRTWEIESDSLKLEVEVSGLRRAMYCRHCPLGFRKQGCSACYNKESRLIQNPDGLIQKLVFHPEADCCTELLLDQSIKNEANLSMAKRFHSPDSLVLRYNYCL